MKILKILLIVLVPALGIVGCKKSDLTCEHPEKSTTPAVPNNSENTEVVNGRMAFDAIENQDTEGTDIVGSGDDDRDGGDKKQKKGGSR